MKFNILDDARPSRVVGDLATPAIGSTTFCAE